VLLCEDRKRVGADLVGRVPVGGDAVGPDDDEVDLALGHEEARHAVRDERCRDAVVDKLPAGETRPLEDGTRLVDEDVEPLALLARRPDHAQGRPVAGRGQGARVAVGEDVVAVADEGLAVQPDAAVDLDVLLADGDGLPDEGLFHLRDAAGEGFVKAALHPLDGPEKVACRGARLRESLAEPRKGSAGFRDGCLGKLQGAQGDSHGSGHPDGRGAADGEVPDGPDHVAPVREGQVVHLARQGLLVDEHDGVVGPEDGPDHDPVSIFLSRSLTSCGLALPLVIFIT